jgi:hypothetical protein
MPLTEAEIETYRRDGLLFPKRVLATEEALDLRAELEAYERDSGGPVQGKYRYECHLVFPWIDRLMRRDSILDLVERLIGPDIMLWTTNLYPKEPGDGRFLSWHQDSAHWGLDSNRIVSVWIALTPANQRNGCMRMLPESHRAGPVPHRDTSDTLNLLTRGQTIGEAIDESRAVWVALAPGEASFHHVDMWHSSPANRSSGRRIGVALRYITPDARQQRVSVDYATLVRGEDRFGHFKPGQRPASLMHPDALAFHEKVAAIQGAIFLHGTERAGIGALREK